jgi:hypothetical protein
MKKWRDGDMHKQMTAPHREVLWEDGDHRGDYRIVWESDISEREVDLLDPDRTEFIIERSDGRDAMGETRWVTVEDKWSEEEEMLKDYRSIVKVMAFEILRRRVESGERSDDPFSKLNFPLSDKAE